MMYWINFLHFYQPPYQNHDIIHKVTKESYIPLIEELKKNPRAKITCNISGSLIEHLYATKNEIVIDGFRELLESKQIEITGSACYHPILPLLPAPEIQRQIELNNEVLKKAFGDLYHPSGFFLPELAYNRKAAKIIKKMGFKWIILDEINYNGRLNSVQFQKKYKIKNNGLLVIFRNREISKTYVPRTLFKLLESTSIPPVIITATDAEMYGHHHKNGHDLLARAYRDERIHTLTVSQYIEMFPTRSELIDPITASWETTPADLEHHIPFILWDDPRNRIHQLLWKLRKLAIRIVNRNTHSPNYEWARYHLDRGLASCAWWWASEKKPDVFSPITWNPDEIEKGIKELISSIRSLANISPETKLRAEKIYQQLIKEIWSHHWKKYHPSIYEQTQQQLGTAFYLLNMPYLMKLFTKKLQYEIQTKGSIADIKIFPYKHQINQKSYHIVTRYVISFARKHAHPVNVFCNANSREPRKGTFKALQFISGHGFTHGKYRAPVPLFYQQKLKAMFYYEIPGSVNLYEYITQKHPSIIKIKKQVALTAQWLKKLHSIPAVSAKNFNARQSSIATVVPGKRFMMNKIQEKHPDYPEFKDKIEALYKIIIRLDRVNSHKIKKSIIHGDFHPENVIIKPYGKNSIGVIDYTDCCIADPMRDLGNFMQQFNTMMHNHISPENTLIINKIFLKAYFKKINLPKNIENRLNLYTAWTALRSAMYFLTIRDFDIHRAKKLLKETKNYLKKIIPNPVSHISSINHHNNFYYITKKRV